MVITGPNFQFLNEGITVRKRSWLLEKLTKVPIFLFTMFMYVRIYKYIQVSSVREVSVKPATLQLSLAEPFPSISSRFHHPPLLKRRMIISKFHILKTGDLRSST